MKAVGTKVLKDNLSKYLKMVREGETILVTDRDEVIAEIHRPTTPIPGKVSRWEAFLNEEVRRGRMTRAATGKAPPFERLLRLPRPEKPIDLQELLDYIKAD
jgi:antitoxin (DNA-binding transcriptional repressor) of toxin-antitoxin stability system